MGNESEKELGKINVSEDVIGSIASLAALEVDGVVEMVGGLTKDIAAKLGKKNQTKGVKVSRNDNELIIDIYLILRYGVQIEDTGYNVQKKVKHSIEVMTGLNVIQININVEGVQLKVDE